MSITCALLTMEAMTIEPSLDENGWDYPTHTLSDYASEFDKQTEGWDWSVVCENTKFASWADVVTTLARGIVPQIMDHSVPEIPWAMKHFLRDNFPNKFLETYEYSLSNGNILWGGYDNGTVEAIHENQALELARKEITEGFAKINKVLVENNLPTFDYDLDELRVRIISK